jgi:hypothetical protein
MFLTGSNIGLGQIDLSCHFDNKQLFIVVDSTTGVGHPSEAIKQGLFIVIVVVTIHQICKFGQIMGVFAGMSVDE